MHVFTTVPKDSQPIVTTAADIELGCYVAGTIDCSSVRRLRPIARFRGQN